MIVDSGKTGLSTRWDCAKQQSRPAKSAFIRVHLRFSPHAVVLTPTANPISRNSTYVFKVHKVRSASSLSGRRGAKREDAKPTKIASTIADAPM